MKIKLLGKMSPVRKSNSVMPRAVKARTNPRMITQEKAVRTLKPLSSPMASRRRVVRKISY